MSAYFVSSGSISLLVPRLPKWPGLCYLNRFGNVGNLGSNKEIQPQIPEITNGQLIKVVIIFLKKNNNNNSITNNHCAKKLLFTK